MRFQIQTDAKLRVVDGHLWIRFTPLLLILMGLPWYNFNLPFGAPANLEVKAMMIFIAPLGFVVASIVFPITILKIDRFADSVKIDVWYLVRTNRDSFPLTDVTGLAVEKTEKTMPRHVLTTYPVMRMQINHENGAAIFPDEFVGEHDGPSIERILNWIAKARWGKRNWRDGPHKVFSSPKRYG